MSFRSVLPTATQAAPISEPSPKRGELPPVVFIDPSFVDVPPVALASDDAPPANLKHGQGLVADVIPTHVESPQWPQTMLILPYDAHGGFFDHVPPPGTQFGPPSGEASFRGSIPTGPTISAFAFRPSSCLLGFQRERLPRPFSTIHPF